MEGPGRRSPEARASGVTLVPGKRPEPPSHLADDEKKLWKEIVDGLPYDWFGIETRPLLAGYVQSICIRDIVARRLHEVREGTLVLPHAEEKDLMEQHTDLNKIILAQATSMRLTQRSRYQGRGARTEGKRGAALAQAKHREKVKPWMKDLGDDEDAA